MGCQLRTVQRHRPPVDLNPNRRLQQTRPPQQWRSDAEGQVERHWGNDVLTGRWLRPCDEADWWHLHLHWPIQSVGAPKMKVDSNRIRICQPKLKLRPKNETLASCMVCIFNCNWKPAAAQIPHTERNLYRYVNYLDGFPFS